MIELSIREIEDFKESKIWKAMLEKLNEFLEDIHMASEDRENTFGDYRELSGNALTVRRVMAIPDVLKHDAELRIEELQNRRKE